MIRSAVCFLLVTTMACDLATSSSREAALRSALSKQDRGLAITRPELLAEKYRRMSEDLYSFFRGSLPIWWFDLGHGAMGDSDNVLAPGLGDAHLENFGTLMASDGSLGFEPNDFDSAERWPFRWDVQRLCTSLVLAARLSNADDELARNQVVEHELDIARTFALAYAQAMSEPDAQPGRIEDGASSAYLDDLFRRARRDAMSHAELSELTELNGQTRSLLVGQMDDGDETLERVSQTEWPDFQRLLDTYSATLAVPRSSAYFRVLDVVRQFGSGVASLPRVRYLVLVQGASDDPSDDIILEIKELSDLPLGGWLQSQRVARTNDARVHTLTQRMWARVDADPLWGTAQWRGMPIQVRTESEAHKTARVARFKGELGTTEAMEDFATVLGGLLARVHSCRLPYEGSARRTIASAIGTNLDAFADDEALAAVHYADIVERDFALFKDALMRHGPLLGMMEGTEWDEFSR